MGERPLAWCTRCQALEGGTTECRGNDDFGQVSSAPSTAFQALATGGTVCVFLHVCAAILVLPVFAALCMRIPIHMCICISHLSSTRLGILCLECCVRSQCSHVDG